MVNIKKLIISILMFILLLSFVSAASVREYPVMGYSEANINSADLFADYNVTNTINGTVTFIKARNGTGESPAVIGNVDSDLDMEIIYDDGNGLHILQWNQDLQTYVEEYAESSITIHTPITLFDGDNDSINEMYFCGVDNAVGNSTFYSFQVNASGLVEVWRNQIGDGVSNPDSSSDLACVHEPTTGGLSPENADAIYTPVCTTTDSRKYCLFVGGCDNSLCNTRRSNYITFYRFDADDGGETKYEPIQNAKPEFRVIGGISAAVYAWGLNYGAINGDRKTVVTAVCDLDGDNKDEWLIPVQAQDPAASGINAYYSLNVDTMTADTNFDTNGVQQIDADENSVWSSPSCVLKTTGDYEVYANFEDTANSFDFMVIEGDGTLTNTPAGTTGDLNTNLWFGEFNGDGTNDMCSLILDQTTAFRFSCMNTEGVFLDLAQHSIATGQSTLRQTVLSTDYSDLGAGPSNLAGDLNGDVLTSFGIFIGNPDDESFVEAIYSYGYGVHAVSAGDIDSDGFTDIILINDTGMELIRSNATGSNAQVDLKQVIPDVRGRVMCGNSNQTFRINAPTTGYEDDEGNNVRVQWRCNVSAGYDNTSFTSYGAQFTVGCFYNTTGSHLAKICMQDNIHSLNDQTECVNIETIVTNAEGCEDPDGVYDSADVVEDDTIDSEVDESDTPPLTTDLIGTFEKYYAFAGADDQNERDLLSMIFLIVVVTGIGLSQNNKSAWIVGIIVAILGMSMMSFLPTSDGGTLLRPIYLLTIVIVGLVFLFIFRPLMGRGGGE